MTYFLDRTNSAIRNSSRKRVFVDTGRSVGRALATGDHNGDGLDDLAVASLLPAPNPLAPEPTTGKVKVFLGSASGLTSSGTFRTRAAKRLGHALAFGDVDGDGRDELAIGVPYDDIPTPGGAFPLAVAAGTVDIWDTNGPESTWSQQRLAGVEPELNDRFAWALATADFNGDGIADLAVGVPFEDIGDTKNAGMVQVVPGSASGLTATNAVRIHQDRPGVASAPEAWDQFGWALHAGGLGRSARADLAIGIPGEDIGSVADAGAVGVFYGSSAGPTATDSQFWSQNSAGIADTPSTNDKFGSTLG
jgi:hypothetical protein